MAKVFRAAAIAAAAASAAFSTPAFAAFNMSGYYEAVTHEDEPDRGGGPEPGDYLGLPINDAARLRGDTWNGSVLTVPEIQCRPHDAFYGWHAVGSLEITETVDRETQRLVKINTNIDLLPAAREIWMDGRPHPPESAPHTYQGFSTGRWEGDVLVVRTTHLKESHVRRNGIVHSDRATVEERFFYHEGVLNHVQMLNDPVYLTEPYVRTTVFVRRPSLPFFAFPCRPAVEVPRPRGAFPHNALRDTSASVSFAREHNLPLTAVRGGAETALPEIMDLPAAAPAKADRAKAK